MVDRCELKRRAEVSKHVLVEREMDACATPPNRSLSDPSQAVVIVNVLNKDSTPKSDTPYLRVLGAFPSQAEAAQWAKEHQAAFKGCDTKIITSYGWLAASENADDNQLFITQLLLHNAQIIIKSHTEFNKRREQLNPDKIESSVIAPNPAYDEAVKYVASVKDVPGLQFDTPVAITDAPVVTTDAPVAITDDPMDGASVLPGILTTPVSSENQNFDLTNTNVISVAKCVAEFDEIPTQRLCLISSVHRDNKVAFIFHGAFATEEEALGFEYVHLRTVWPTVAIHCVKVGAWIPLDKMESMRYSTCARFRIDEQDRIMTHRIKRPLEADAYIRKTKRDGFHVPDVIEIEPDLLPDATQPEASQPEATLPEASQPEATQPEASQPETTA